jgi:hypothetical protein
MSMLEREVPWVAGERGRLADDLENKPGCLKVSHVEEDLAGRVGQERGRAAVQFAELAHVLEHQQGRAVGAEVAYPALQGLKAPQRRRLIEQQQTEAL